MREARARRVGQWVAQKPKHCWLTSVCIAKGYKYSRARQERYDPIAQAQYYDEVTEAMIELQGPTIAKLYRSHAALIKAKGWGHRMYIPRKAHGVIHMFTRRYQHTVAIIDGMIVDPSPHAEQYAGNETWEQHCSRMRLRPTTLIYEEIRP